MGFQSLKEWREDLHHITVLYPGGFKPLTGGHLSLIRRYSLHESVSEIKVLIGPGIRDGINQETAFNIANEILKDVPKVVVESVKYPSPVLTSYRYVGEASRGKFALASSTKEKENAERIQKFYESHQPGGKYQPVNENVAVVILNVDNEPALYEGRTDEHNNTPISASILRQDLKNKDFANFKTNYPNEDIKTIEKIWTTLYPSFVSEGVANMSAIDKNDKYKEKFLIAPLTEDGEDGEDEEEKPLKLQGGQHNTSAGSQKTITIYKPKKK
ncbi:MAG: hypothetical protein ACFFKA_19150 [Candidatus Thorarchaeota archaeon]